MASYNRFEFHKVVTYSGLGLGYKKMTRLATSLFRHVISNTIQHHPNRKPDCPHQPAFKDRELLNSHSRHIYILQKNARSSKPMDAVHQTPEQQRACSFPDTKPPPSRFHMHPSLWMHDVCLVFTESLFPPRAAFPSICLTNTCIHYPR